MGSISFDRDRLVADAIAAVGSDDFGEPTWQEGLDRLLDSLAAEARLSALGVTVVETEVGGYLRNRLGIVAHRAAHPELGDRPITRPLVIVGQPRTGTTILYDLLAQDPANRAPLTWEVDLPCPPPAHRHLRHRPAHRRERGDRRDGRPRRARLPRLPPDRARGWGRSACGSRGASSGR